MYTKNIWWSGNVCREFTKRNNQRQLGHKCLCAKRNMYPFVSNKKATCKANNFLPPQNSKSRINSNHLSRILATLFFDNTVEIVSIQNYKIAWGRQKCGLSDLAHIFQSLTRSLEFNLPSVSSSYVRVKIYMFLSRCQIQVSVFDCRRNQHDQGTNTFIYFSCIKNVNDV